LNTPQKKRWIILKKNAGNSLWATFLKISLQKFPCYTDQNEFEKHRRGIPVLFLGELHFGPFSIRRWPWKESIFRVELNFHKIPHVAPLQEIAFLHTGQRKRLEIRFHSWFFCMNIITILGFPADSLPASCIHIRIRIRRLWRHFSTFPRCLYSKFKITCTKLMLKKMSLFWIYFCALGKLSIDKILTRKLRVDIYFILFSPWILKIPSKIRWVNSQFVSTIPENVIVQNPTWIYFLCNVNVKSIPNSCAR